MANRVPKYRGRITGTQANGRRALADAGATRDRAVFAILTAAKLRNEAGSDVTTFHQEGRDALDFMTVSKAQLKALLVEAFENGVVQGRIDAKAK